jgi:hypothetical protein
MQGMFVSVSNLKFILYRSFSVGTFLNLKEINFKVAKTLLSMFLYIAFCYVIIGADTPETFVGAGSS